MAFDFVLVLDQVRIKLKTGGGCNNKQFEQLSLFLFVLFVVYISYDGFNVISLLVVCKKLRWWG